MTSSINSLIRKTEEKWLQILFEGCKQQFSGIHLPSHDETHHLRVWQYAKLLIHTLKESIIISGANVEQLIIAIFFHDQGMSKILSKEHGKISRQICEAYFETSSLPCPPDFEKVLLAIEEHDKKDYPQAHSTREDFNLQKLLNIADDLDAFGSIGAYRYLEIYLLRGTDIQIIADVIATNLHGRFRHFSSTFGADSDIVKSQHSNFAEAMLFFNDLKSQLQNQTYNPKIVTGPIGVLNYINNEIIKKRLSLSETGYRVISEGDDSYCTDFFEKILNQLHPRI